jgi:hypothetical protein
VNISRTVAALVGFGRRSVRVLPPGFSAVSGGALRSFLAFAEAAAPRAAPAVLFICAMGAL